MDQILCPRCGSECLFHYTDAYVLRTPFLDDKGSLRLIDEQTTEFDENFFQCARCGHRPEEDDLVPGVHGESISA
jgi:DNA-directed RNA polymerase subunit RPC12/RpoP